MRGAVVLADVCLDLDDPAADPADERIVRDQARPDEGPRRVERRAGQQVAGERRVRGQGRGKSAWMSDGTSGPVTATNSGMSVSRKTDAVPDALTAAYRSLIWATC